MFILASTCSLLFGCTSSSASSDAGNRPADASGVSSDGGNDVDDAGQVVGDAGNSMDDAGPCGGETYDQAISYAQSRPSFTPTRTVDVSNASELKSAISNLQAGDLVKATAPFTVSGETTIKARLSATAELDVAGVKFVYSGSSNVPAVYVDNAENLHILGGDVTSGSTGGDCVTWYGSQHVLWWGFYLHDCGMQGIRVQPVPAAVDHDDLQGEITNAGLDRARDPHAEKGTGLHGVLLWDDSGQGNPFTNNRFAFYIHDQPSGAGVEVGNNEAAPSGANVLYEKAANLTEVATQQTGGNGLQIWGYPVGLDVKYLEVSNAQGRALDVQGLHDLTAGAKGVTVECGRASNTNHNTALNEPNNQLPWDTRGGVVYENVQPPP